MTVFVKRKKSILRVFINSRQVTARLKFCFYANFCFSLFVVAGCAFISFGALSLNSCTFKWIFILSSFLSSRVWFFCIIMLVCRLKFALTVWPPIKRYLALLRLLWQKRPRIQFLQLFFSLLLCRTLQHEWSFFLLIIINNCLISTSWFACLQAIFLNLNVDKRKLIYHFMQREVSRSLREKISILIFGYHRVHSQIRADKRIW